MYFQAILCGSFRAELEYIIAQTAVGSTRTETHKQKTEAMNIGPTEVFTTHASHCNFNSNCSQNILKIKCQSFSLEYMWGKYSSTLITINYLIDLSYMF